jgi:hypothetical protein
MNIKKELKELNTPFYKSFIILLVGLIPFYFVAINIVCNFDVENCAERTTGVVGVVLGLSGTGIFFLLFWLFGGFKKENMATTCDKCNGRGYVQK